ncbi:MAG: diguanylate cyclase domain-containing protein [Actinomycetota bacterium]
MSERATRLLRSESEDLPVAVIFLDRNLRTLNANDAWRRLEPEEGGPQDADWGSVCDPRDRAGVADVLNGVIASGGEATLEVRGTSPDHWIELLASAVESNGAEEIVIVALDVTDQKQREAMLTFDAVRDQLTGLHNRVALGQHLRGALDRLRRQPSILAVLFIDLDGFREVNEKHGHLAGDRVLLIAAQQLRLAIRPADLLARVGGDEFVAVCESLSSAEEALGVARRLAESLDKPIEVSPTAEHQLSATIGVAFAAGPNEEVGALLARADMAMYAAKQQGRGRVQVHAPTVPNNGFPPLGHDRDRLDDVAERLAMVEGDLAEGWATSLTQSDAQRTQRWRSACHYADLALAALRGRKPPDSLGGEESRAGDKGA